jgi:hypothetical protein
MTANISVMLRKTQALQKLSQVQPQKLLSNRFLKAKMYMFPRLPTIHRARWRASLFSMKRVNSSSLHSSSQSLSIYVHLRSTLLQRKVLDTGFAIIHSLIFCWLTKKHREKVQGKAIFRTCWPRWTR